MLRVAAKNTYCNDKTCPQVLEDTDMAVDVYVQGYDDVGPAVVRQADTPAGEHLVRVPRQMLIEAGRRFEEDQLFATCGSAFRLETLPQYQTASDERFHAFREGRPLPERSVATDPWLAQLAGATAAGHSWQRVHVVTQPLSEYLRYELLTGLENVAAGEDVRIADRDVFPELATLTRDFWLFDADAEGATALLLRYDHAGEYLGAEISTDPDVLNRCWRQRALALSRSIPLAAYLDTVGLVLRKAG
jgi:hypothetical protein